MPKPAANSTKGINIRKGKRIMSIEGLNFWSNWLLVASLVIGVVATAVIIVTGNIKENALRRELSEAASEAAKSNERAARAHEHAAEANKAAEDARERAALLEKESVAARIELEKLKDKQRDRKMDQQQADKLLNFLHPSPKMLVRVMALSTLQETADFAVSIRSVLSKAGFGNRLEMPIEYITGVSLVEPEGKRVVIACTTNDELNLMGIIKAALNASGIPTGAIINTNIMKPGEFGIMVAEK